MALYDRLRSDGHQVHLTHSARESIEQAVSLNATQLFYSLDQASRAALDQLPAEWTSPIVLFLDETADVALLRTPSSVCINAFVCLQQGQSTESLYASLSPYLSGKLPTLPLQLSKDTALNQVQITSSIKRGEALYEIEQYATKQGLDARFVSQYLTIADEFITNAFYNAPVDAAGGHLFAHVSRLEIVEPPRDRPVQVSYACDDQRAIIAVRDGFGSMDKQTLLDCLASTNRGLSEARIQSRGGAGLGIYTAFRSASHLSFHVAPTRFTECIGMLDIANGYRAYLNRGKSFEVFYQDLPD
jgi:hypothetical protein